MSLAAEGQALQADIVILRETALRLLGGEPTKEGITALVPDVQLAVDQMVAVRDLYWTGRPGPWEIRSARNSRALGRAADRQLENDQCPIGGLGSACPARRDCRRVRRLVIKVIAAQVISDSECWIRRS
jgi:hypothetical protein